MAAPTRALPWSASFLHRGRRMSASRARAGWVYLVGAGPGDPGLVTLKAKGLLESCDSVLYDQLGTEGALGFVPPSA